MSIIFDNTNPENILICHSEYWNTFNGCNTSGSMDVLQKIHQCKYPTMRTKKIKPENVKQLYNNLMEKYRSELTTTIQFNVYQGAIARDFVSVNDKEFATLLQQCD